MTDGQEDYAIVVGINRYPGLNKPLFAAEQDATRFAEWICSAEGGNVPVKNLSLILSSRFAEPLRNFDAKPVKDNIDLALLEFGVGSKTRVGHRLYFYFAGHGIGPSFDDVVLLMANATPSYYPNVALRPYRSYLRDAAPFDELVFILDCCREFNTRVTPAPPNFPERKAEDRAPDVRECVILAAQYGRQAFEPVEGASETRGLLTEALLEVLQQGRPTGGNVRIDAKTLTDNLARRVSELAKATGMEQVPVCHITGEVFFRAPQAPTTGGIEIEIIPDPQLVGELILEGGDLSELGRHQVSDGPWNLVLQPGLYNVVHAESDQSWTFDTRKFKERPHVIRVS